MSNLFPFVAYHPEILQAFREGLITVTLPVAFLPCRGRPPFKVKIRFKRGETITTDSDRERHKLEMRRWREKKTGKPMVIKVKKTPEQLREYNRNKMREFRRKSRSLGKDRRELQSAN